MKMARIAPVIALLLASPMNVLFEWPTMLNTAYAQPIDYGDIDLDRLPPERWTNYQFEDPSGWSSVDVTTAGLIPNQPSIDASIQFAAILANNPGRTRFYFPAGTYYFKSQLFIDRGDVWIDGDGPSTEFRLDAPSSTVLGITFRGQDLPVSTINAPMGFKAITSPITRGDDFFVASDVTGLTVGDFVEVVFREPTLKRLPNSVPVPDEPFLVGQIVKITDISGNVVTVSEKLGLDMPTSKSPQFRELSLIQNVKVENIRFFRVNDNADPAHNLEFIAVDNALVRNIESERSAKHHISALFSRRIIVENSTFKKAWDIGQGGHGYGVNFQLNTSFSRITNNVFSELRHPVSIHFGSNHNVVSYNVASLNAATGDDFILHGRGAHNNLFEGNFSDSNILADGVHGTELRNNTLFRNRGRDVGNDASGGLNLFNLIANEHTRTLTSRGGQDYIAENINDGGSIGVVNGTIVTLTDIPNSLYLDFKPSFVATWPLYGPGAGSADAVFTFEAEDLSRSTNGPVSEIIIDNDASEGEWVILRASALDDWIQFELPSVPQGNYEVFASYKTFNSRGLASAESPPNTTLSGRLVDMYQPNIEYKEASFGKLSAPTTGNKIIRFKVAGINPSSSDFRLSFDKIELRPIVQGPNCLVGTQTGTLTGNYLISNAVLGLNKTVTSTFGGVQATTEQGPTAQWTFVDSNNDGEFGITSAANGGRLEAVLSTGATSVSSGAFSDPVRRWKLIDSNNDGNFGLVNVEFDPNHTKGVGNFAQVPLDTLPYQPIETWTICSAN